MRGFEGGAFDEANARDYPTAEMLERHLMLAFNSHDEILPTTAGLLLFGVGAVQWVHSLLHIADFQKTANCAADGENDGKTF